MFCYISSHLIKVKAKTKNSQTYNELFSLCCRQITSAAIAGILNQSLPMDVFTWSKPVKSTASHCSNSMGDS